LYVDTKVLEEHTVFIFRAEDGDNMFFRNSGIYLQGHTALLHRRPTSMILSDVNFLCDHLIGNMKANYSSRSVFNRPADSRVQTSTGLQTVAFRLHKIERRMISPCETHRLVWLPSVFDVSFQVLTAVKMWVVVFWVVTPRSLANGASDVRVLWGQCPLLERGV
jgi:hypothetical protein